MGLVGGLNGYEYATNSPLNFVDPTGSNGIRPNPELGQPGDFPPNPPGVPDPGRDFIVDLDLKLFSLVLDLVIPIQFFWVTSWLPSFWIPNSDVAPRPPEVFGPFPVPSIFNINSQIIVQVGGASDPNSMIGPAGYGTQNVVSDDATLPYQVDFENSPSATAPAQSVTITDQLDSNLDWSAFELTGIGWGDTVLTIPAGSQQFETTVSMTDNGQTFNVDVEAGIDTSTGQVYTTFQSVDPSTDLPPNVLTGFLPPEDGTGRGMGYISFLIQPNPGLPTGTQIRNVALISFDEQPSIATDQVNDEAPSEGVDPSKEALITIDGGPPTSSVLPLPAVEPSTTFTVSWSGQEDPGGSGIAYYDLYVSVDGGAYLLWGEQTTATSASFTGQAGDTYAFYSVATDNVGNVQPTPTAGQATTTVTVNLVLHQPSVTNATTMDNTPTTSGLVITPNAADTAFVTNFQITNITGGTLYLNDGVTQVTNGEFITVAQGAAGLKFTPTTNSRTSGSSTVQESTSATTAGLGGPTATATITVNLVLHQPSVANATTTDNTQTTSGLVITPNTADTGFVTNFQITNITGGTLFLNNGTTQITDGQFITVPQGASGLKFTPAANSLTSGSFTVQESISTTTAGLGGPTATATIAVNLVLNQPSVTNATTTDNTHTTSGLVVIPNAADMAFVTNFQITNITGGTLFSNDGVTQVTNGEFITVAQGAAGLKFTPASNSLASGSFTVQESTSTTTAGLGGSSATATIAVNLVLNQPSVTNATTTDNTQTTSGLVITPNAADTGFVSNFQITNIIGGTLYLNDGVTQVTNGEFITVAQRAAGLKFTPASNSLASGSFTVQESTSAPRPDWVAPTPRPRSPSTSYCTLRA